MNYWFGLGIGLVGLLGCPGDDGDDSTGAGASSTGDSESGSTGSGSGSGSTSSDPDTNGSTGGPSTDSGGTGTTDGTQTSGATDSTDSAGSASSESDSDTDGPSSLCVNDEIELAGVVFDVTTNRVFGEDVDTPFDPAQNSRACLSINEGSVRLIVDYGPFDPHPLSRLILNVHDGARSYDLAEDPADPGTGERGLIRLSYGLEEGATTYSFGTVNQAATGTVDVIGLPVDGGLTLEFDAVGEIAGPDGWEFDIHFTGSIPR